MEGTAGVCSWAQVDPSNPHEYPVYRRYMTREVAAAITGARESQPCDVTVNDSHWDMRNLMWDELPTDVRVISGRKPLSMAQGAAERFDAAFFTGYHSAVGVADSVLAHTYSNEVFYNVYVNGTACTEALLNAALLGAYGTPVALITGDRAIVEATLVEMPWATGVIVKESIGYFAANSLTPQAAYDAIQAGAREAMAGVAKAKPFTFQPPIELVIETAGVQHADFIELLPRFERTGGRTVRFVSDDYETAFRAFIVAMRLAGAANLPA
ncbi:MAG: M55 family metallopeptidase [Candidatus Eremiobacteraeota bacterium]|nr:M55 family metallopeptidase [Candidatus Eremiobacteraeota bacterium]